MLILDVEFDARDNYQSVAPCIRDRPGILPYLTMVGYRDNIEPELLCSFALAEILDLTAT